MARDILDKSKRGWWKSAVFYELYPRSFQDTTGTGVGDLRGIVSRLDYLETLGIEDGYVQELSSADQKYIPLFDLTGV